MIKFNEFVKSKVFIIICLMIYSVITIYRIINHVPFTDEAHAWLLAENLSFWEMFNEVKNEGHFFIWQTILYPFAKLHLYPYSMQAINWIFCTLAIILMWCKAPFNNIMKALITFSFPFLGCYSVIARCYSIGILLLFLLAILFDKKLKYPKTYALLLILCANTSVMALLGASAFALIFIYHLFKHKPLSFKNNVWVSVILSIGVILISYQLFNMDYFTPITSNRRPHISIGLFRNVFVYNNLWVNLLLLGILSVPIFKFLYKYKFALFFLSYTYFFLLVFTTAVYGGYFWHSYFFFIYLIIAFWICLNWDKGSKVKTYAIVSFCVIAFILIFHIPTKREYFFVFRASKAGEVVKFIQSDELLKNAQFIQNDGLLMDIRPLSSTRGFKVRTHCSNEIYSDVSMIHGDNKLCVVKRTVEQAKKEPQTVKNIVESYDGNTFTYIDTQDYATNRTFYNIKADGYSIYFKKYKCYDRYCFWKIDIKYED